MSIKKMPHISESGYTKMLCMMRRRRRSRGERRREGRFAKHLVGFISLTLIRALNIHHIILAVVIEEKDRNSEIIVCQGHAAAGR